MHVVVGVFKGQELKETGGQTQGFYLPYIGVVDLQDTTQQLHTLHHNERQTALTKWTARSHIWMADDMMCVVLAQR